MQAPVLRGIGTMRRWSRKGSHAKAPSRQVTEDKRTGQNRYDMKATSKAVIRVAACGCTPRPWRLGALA
ncbi:MAG TPA: hypothetical protein DCL54_08215 [Alphaproteobacteria bacterium]|nr:hypothetical protein [Alphaproteobacteria bacterium]